MRAFGWVFTCRLQANLRPRLAGDGHADDLSPRDVYLPVQPVSLEQLTENLARDHLQKLQTRRLRRLTIVGAVFYVICGAFNLAALGTPAAFLTLFAAAVIHITAYMVACREQRFATNTFLSEGRLRCLVHGLGLLWAGLLFTGAMYGAGGESICLWYLIFTPAFISYGLHSRHLGDTVAWGCVTAFLVILVHVIGYLRTGTLFSVKMGSLVILGAINTTFGYAQVQAAHQQLHALREREQRIAVQTVDLIEARDRAVCVYVCVCV